ncbi:MAG: hypothetical protein ACHQT7_00400 [Candidatus Levyibacteriota bacterium]
MGVFNFFPKTKSPVVGADKTVFENLKNKFSEKHEEIKTRVVLKHKNALALLTNYPTQIAAGVMGTALVFGNVLPVAPPSHALAVESNSIDPSAFLISDLRSSLPSDVRPLTSPEEANISTILTRDFNMPVSAELDGIRLNRSYGLIGAEQHLALYPGDAMGSHLSNPQDFASYGEQGMAPGLGAWGYFAPSRYDMTQKEIDREKYYIAVQTFLAPGFSTNTKRYIEFFKYRKMLVVNPENGKAMVVDIGDAGPGESTGKHLGGSPEVMKYLERFDGAQRGPVLYFFINDPTDSIPLGPVTPKVQT